MCASSYNVAHKQLIFLQNNFIRGESEKSNWSCVLYRIIALRTINWHRCKCTVIWKSSISRVWCVQNVCWPVIQDTSYWKGRNCPNMSKIIRKAITSQMCLPETTVWRWFKMQKGKECNKNSNKILLEKKSDNTLIFLFTSNAGDHVEILTLPLTKLSLDRYFRDFGAVSRIILKWLHSISPYHGKRS